MEKLICSPTEFVGIIEDTLNEGGKMPLVVTGNSMNPFLKDGKDVVWLEKCRESDFKRGKILLFRRSGGKIVLHRVLKVKPDGTLIMNGDAQFWCEDIKKEQALAAVTHIEVNGKKISCNSLAYRFRTAVWQCLKPLRPLIFRVYRKLKRIFGKSE